jgi:hypothetical protein
MDPLLIAGIVSQGIGVVVSVIASAIAEGDYEKARQIRAEVAKQFGDELLPELDQQVAQTVDPTELSKIQEDPELRAAQVAAMRKLEALYQSGGTSPQDEAALQLANMGAEQRAASDYQSMAQNLAARGQTLNPALAAAMAAQSSGAVVGATARNRYQAQADARDKALRALESSAGLAGNIRSQDYGIASNAAQAQDRINQFNATQRQETGWRNTQLTQQEFENLVRLREQRAAAQMGTAGDYSAKAGRTQQIGAGIGGGISSIGGGLMEYGLKKGGG